MSLQDFAEFIRVLNDHRVRYLVIGGYAVGFHGHARATNDLDVLIAPDEENIRRVERAMVDFVGTAPPRDALRARRGMMRIGGPVTHIGVTTKVDGLAAFDSSLDAAQARRPLRRAHPLPLAPGPPAHEAGREPIEGPGRHRQARCHPPRKRPPDVMARDPRRSGLRAGQTSRLPGQVSHLPRPTSDPARTVSALPRPTSAAAGQLEDPPRPTSHPAGTPSDAPRQTRATAGQRSDLARPASATAGQRSDLARTTSALPGTTWDLPRPR